jgi:hypothetical protein
MRTEYFYCFSVLELKNKSSASKKVVTLGDSLLKHANGSRRCLKILKILIFTKNMGFFAFTADRWLTGKNQYHFWHQRIKLHPPTEKNFFFFKPVLSFENLWNLMRWCQKCDWFFPVSHLSAVNAKKPIFLVKIKIFSILRHLLLPLVLSWQTFSLKIIWSLSYKMKPFTCCSHS